jgi:hypothetical protein
LRLLLGGAESEMCRRGGRAEERTRGRGVSGTGAM